jgi:hypothetical protein
MYIEIVIKNKPPASLNSPINAKAGIIAIDKIGKNKDIGILNIAAIHTSRIIAIKMVRYSDPVIFKVASFAKAPKKVE